MFCWDNTSELKCRGHVRIREPSVVVSPVIFHSRVCSKTALRLHVCTECQQEGGPADLAEMMLAIIAQCSDEREGGDDCQDRPSSFLFETASFTSLVVVPGFNRVCSRLVWRADGSARCKARRVFLFRLSSVSNLKRKKVRVAHYTSF